MASAELDTAPETQSDVTLESGTYEIIRNRLRQHGKDLRERLERLNHERKEVFGSIETRLLGTERITTDHNCQPRDLVAIGNRFIFGYNVHFGLKTEISLGDVFAVYEFRDNTFHQMPLDLLDNDEFRKHFKDIYRYYKSAVFAKFFVQGTFLYMVFRVGKSPADIKAFKWAIQGDQLVYVDNRSDHEVRFPPQHEFTWTRTTRDMHHFGEHPHISIADRVFVETVGGDLTVKVENNTESGEGIYAEPVDNPDQTLDDAEIHYAIIGNIILLKIRPYLEKDFRFIVFNEKMQQAKRIDSIQHACVLLPDDHGLIFPNGYYLQSGEYKTFDLGLDGLLFERQVRSPNGEDFLYIFYNRDSGVTVLLQYNLIEQQVTTPLVCNGATIFGGGELVCFRSHDEPQKHHAVQIWQTPYVGQDYTPHADTDSMLYKIGNQDIVRAMAECHEILGLIEKEDTYGNLYVDLVKLAGDVIDSYFWIDKEETHNLKAALVEIKGAAAAAVDEFEKVVRVRQNTTDQTRRVERQAKQLITSINHKRFDNINDFVQSLAQLRAIRGEIISLGDLRYVDRALVESLEKEAAEYSERLAQRCVQFLLQPSALVPYDQAIERHRTQIENVATVADGRKLEEQIGASAGELEMLIEIVSNLRIDDATHRTAIIDNISAIFAKVNQARSALKARARELMSVEGIAEFNSQMKLLNQAVVNYLDLCDSPAKCEEFLTKMMIQIEELEGKFAEFDEFVVQLTEKREEIYNAFENRKVALIEARNKRATALASAADRILKGIKTRVDSLPSINDIHGYFASDLMIEKVRDLVEQLKQLDDTVKVDDIHSRLKTIREDAVRQLKDRQDLFEGGENVIRLGKHRFSVNVQQLDLTTVERDNQMFLHLTGTNFFEPIQDEELNGCRDVWHQEVISENRQVYRAEYLAYQMMREFERDPAWSATALKKKDESELIADVQRYMGPRYQESYSKGVHDHDAAKLLRALVEMKATIGLLRYDPRARALAVLYWRYFGDRQQKKLIAAKLSGFGDVASAFPDTPAQRRYIAQLHNLLDEFVQETTLFQPSMLDQAAEYLFAELTRGDRFAVSRMTADLYEAFQTRLKSAGHAERFSASLAAVEKDPLSRLSLARDWATSFVTLHASRAEAGADELDYIDELAAVLCHGELDQRDIVEGRASRDLSGLVGSHPVIVEGRYHLNFNQFISRLEDFEMNVVPRYRRFNERKKELVDEARHGMRLDEFRPRVLTSFVRSRLIDEVYLPLVGDNLAKQIGVVGEQKRTDLMGLLLVVSPPGYGKTTLMEYIANRLGIIFMKINGPAIGHRVTSLDPVEAPNASAREEVEKLNLALEMGDNVMLYLDDIQHCNPELLQKFISLCDAQRKIEGVYKGRSRTYDLRGRKVVVVMAGNPYTESGEKFQIPDMLSNRADVYNLGEIIGDTAEVFEMSYLENSLTSNPVLNRLGSRSQKDVYSVIRLAQDASREGVSFEGNYSAEELNEMVSVMKKLMRVRDVILTVNREYIRSAAQADAYRTEPPFKLQGSYRNMNRIAEKVVPIMNDRELESLILSNYENEAQTLTSDNEANMLKFKELIGIITPEEKNRWESIKSAFTRDVKLKGVDTSDKFGQAIVQLSSVNDALDSIRRALAEGVSQIAAAQANGDEDELSLLREQFGGFRSSLDEIRDALSGGMRQMASLSERLASASSKNGGGLSAEQLRALLEEFRSSAPAFDPSTLSPKVTVQHKVPRVVLDVVKSQFELMKGWMAPVLTASNLQSADIQRLQQSVDACLNNYSTLLKDLESARSKVPPQRR